MRRKNIFSSKSDNLLELCYELADITVLCGSMPDSVRDEILRITGGLHHLQLQAFAALTSYERRATELSSNRRTRPRRPHNALPTPRR